jgi:xanthine dehydrogenase accessory factor
VATQGKKDEQGLEAALSTGAAYIAFIASARKAQKLKQYLLERGHDRARVEAIIAPAGVEIDAVTPEEIALSVLGGVVQARRGGGLVTASSAAKIRIDKSPVRAPEIKSTPGSAIDPVCGMSVDAGIAEYKTEHAGKTYYFCCAGCQHAFEKTPQRYLAEKAS